jgi:hypothetical protein
MPRARGRAGGTAVLLGAMQDFPLRVMRLVDHAEREHGDREIVSAWADGTITRTNWRSSPMTRGAWRRRSKRSASSPATASRRWR